MLNKDWVGTLSPNDFYIVIDWLLHKYARQYSDSAIAAGCWLAKVYDENVVKTELAKWNITLSSQL